MFVLSGGDNGEDGGAPTHGLRFNYGDSPYLTFTPSGAPTSAQVFTIALWLKKTRNDQTMVILDGFTGAAAHDMLCTSFSGDTNRLQFEARNTNDVNLITSAKLKDGADFYHLCIGVDTTDPTPANRVRIEINRVLQTAFDVASYPALNYSFGFFGANGVAQEIGRYVSNGNYFDGYLADFHYIDGQKKQAADFTEFDELGRLIPKAYTGSYGANGWHPDFSDSSAATAAALGADRSGNGHNFTPNNFSVIAGAGNDALRDCPTDGVTEGNFATWDRLRSVGAPTMVNGNLDVTAMTNGGAVCSMSMRSGKWMCEITGVFSAVIGITDVNFNTPIAAGGGAVGMTAGGSYGYQGSTGNKVVNQVSSAYGATYTTTDLIRVEFDADNGVLEFFKNNVSQGQLSGIATGRPWAFCVGYFTATPGLPIANFGQRPFANTPSAGFKALCTQNLSASEAPTLAGTFVGNGNANGPVVDLGGTPATLSINGNAVVWGTHAIKLAYGAKIITPSASYNAGSNTFTATVAAPRKHARAQIS